MPLSEPSQHQSRPLVVSAAEAKRANAAHVRQLKLEKRALHPQEAEQKYLSIDGYPPTSASVQSDRYSYASGGPKEVPRTSGAFF